MELPVPNKAPAPEPNLAETDTTVQWAVEYVHRGRAPMLLEASVGGQLRCTSHGGGRTAWHGSWRISGTVMTLMFRYKTPTVMLVECVLNHRGGIWTSVSGCIALFDPPPMFEQWLMEGLTGDVDSPIVQDTQAFAGTEVSSSRQTVGREALRPAPRARPGSSY